MDMWREEENEKLRGIYGVLSRLGLSANYTGFFQLAWAVWLAKEEPERLQMVTKRLYPEVAKHYGTNWKAVERNIRSMNEIAWQENRPLLEKLAHRQLTQKPRNAQMLAILVSALEAGPLALREPGDETTEQTKI